MYPCLKIQIFSQKLFWWTIHTHISITVAIFKTSRFQHITVRNLEEETRRCRFLRRFRDDEAIATTDRLPRRLLIVCIGMPNDNRWLSGNTTMMTKMSSRSDVRNRRVLTDRFYNSRESWNVNKLYPSHVGFTAIQTMPANLITRFGSNTELPDRQIQTKYEKPEVWAEES